MRAKFPPMTVVHTKEQIEEILEAVQEILVTGNLIYGKYTQAFEEGMAAMVGKKYGVAVDHDTSGFEIAMRVLGVSGKEVIMPANAFASVVIAVKRAGGTPVFVDMCIEEGMGMQAEDLVEKINGNTGAVIVVHNAGYVSTRIEDIVEYCHKRGVLVFEDAAHTFGSMWRNKYAGSFADVSIYSGYATKVISFGGEGGMLVCDDKWFADEAKIYRNYGRQGVFGKSVFEREGYNWAPTEIQCAIGCVQLKHMTQTIQARQRVVGWYDGAVGDGLVGIKRLPIPDDMVVNGYRYILMAESEELRDFMMTEMQKEGISCPGLVYDMPLNKQPIFKGYSTLNFPVAEDFCRRHFALPVYTDMTFEEMQYVVSKVKVVLNKWRMR